MGSAHPGLTCRGDLAEERGLGRGLGLRQALLVLGGPPTQPFSSGSHCCTQGCRVRDALCWQAGSGHGARLCESRDGTEEEPSTSASPATPTTGVTTSPCWPPKTSSLPKPAKKAAPGASTEGG